MSGGLPCDRRAPHRPTPLRRWATASLAFLLVLPSPCAPRRPASASTSPAAPVSVDVPILMYHYLTEAATPPDENFVTRTAFERQMSALAAYGYQAVSLQDFLDYRSGAAVPPAHPVILTFDDGHDSIYTIARPILEAASLRATLFVTTGFIGESEESRQDEWLVWEPELDTLFAGGFPVESHSQTHANLLDLSQDQARQEILGSRLDVESHLGTQVRFFAYPYGQGAQDPTIRGLVQQAGYLAAVAAWPDGIANTATSDIWALPRVTIREGNSVELDPARPNRFFMRKLDPDFPLPLITVDAVRFRHADGRWGTCFEPGEAVTAVVSVTNEGAAAATRLSLALDAGPEHANPYFSQSIAQEMPAEGSLALTFTVDLPGGLSPGPHFFRLRIQDHYSVLGFLDTGWRRAFDLASTCHRHCLPAISR